MASLFSNSMINSCTTAALFRAWCSFIHNAFMLGFVNVVDAAQIDLTSVAMPSGSATIMGFKIYKTNDALTPVYFKVEFGSGGAQGQPAIYITIGTAYIVGGTLSGVILLPRTYLADTVNDSYTSHLCMAGGAANRICFALFMSLANAPFWFSFERRKDATITDSDTGVLIDYGLATTGHASLCAPFTGIIPVKETGFQFILTTNNPAAYSNIVPQGLRIPCLGPSEPPGMNVAFCNSNDYGSYAEPTLTINTTDIKFKHCGPYIYNLRGSANGCVDINTRLLLRFD